MRLINADDIPWEEHYVPDGDIQWEYKKALTVLKEDVDKMPSVDAICRGVYDQVRWERDIAIGQLDSYGISLGEKADVTKVVHAKWIDCSNGWMCSACERDNTYDKPYCPNCGAKMDLESEGTDECSE